MWSKPGRRASSCRGPSDTFAEVLPYLELLGKRAVLVGDAEQSRLVKLCHNLYLGMMVQALVEVTSLAEKGGTSAPRSSTSSTARC